MSGNTIYSTDELMEATGCPSRVAEKAIDRYRDYEGLSVMYRRGLMAATARILRDQGKRRGDQDR